MNLQEIIARLAKIDEEVRTAEKVEAIDKLATEKKELLERKAELEEIEARKQTALDITAGAVTPNVLETRKDKNMDFEKMTPTEVRGTEEYRSAFLKTLMGKPLTETEKRANEMATTDVPGAIPTPTYDRIFKKLTEHAPLLSEITLLQVPGNVSFAVEGTKNAAARHAENDLVAPAADTVVKITLGGYEYIKVLSISATVKAMAINAFETWLTDNLAESVAEKIGSDAIYGDGEGDPKGIDYAATWEDGTNAVIPAGAKYPTAAEIVKLVSLLKAGYHKNAKFLMNSTDFWGGIVAAQSNDKYKILTDDYSRLLGFPILLDDNVASGDIFFGNFKKVVGNLSQNITVAASEASGFLRNAIDFRGTAIFDCDIAVGEAFVKCAKTLTAGK